MHTFRVLGSLELTGSDGATLLPILAQPKRTALLAYLATARRRGYHRRDQVVALFWPELDQERARAALSTALNHLRRTLGDEVLQTRGTEEIALDREHVWCDAVAFEEAFEAEELERAVELYGGEFLAGVFVADAAEFERWVDGERQRLARAYRSALEQLAARAEGAGERLEAVAWWQRVSEQDPYSTRVALRVMGALEAAGDRAGALQYAEQHADRLRTELDAAPAPDVTAYADRLRAHPAAHPSLAPQTEPVTEPEGMDRLTSALADRYRIERELGRGGMATVYLAEDRKHHRPLAIKVLQPELAAALGPERFLREIEITARLTHPHILPLLDSGTADGLLFYVMPYVEGESLRERLAHEKQLPLEEALRIAAEVADALSFAHGHDVLHRDIKPENILLEGGHAVVADFGLARAISAAGGTRLTESGMSLGTPEYMSPEQAAGQRTLDARSDIYSLGCVLYEMLAGEPPFTGATVESIARQHLTAEPPDVTSLRASVPARIAQSIVRVLAKAPADRFESAAQFAEAIASPASVAGDARPVTAAGGKRWLGRGVFAAALVIVITVAVLALSIWQPWAGDDEPLAGTRSAWTILAQVEGSAPEDVRDLVWSLLAGEIDASQTFQTLPAEQVRFGLERAMKPDTTRLTRSVARELAQRGQISTVFAPELDEVGDTYAMTVRVLPAEGDSVLATSRVSAEDDDALIPASREVVGGLVQALSAWEDGGPRRPWAEPPITFSLAAFRKAHEGLRANLEGRYHEAVVLLREALAIDPDFAMAWVRMGSTYLNAGLLDSAAYAWREALKRPERLTELQRLNVEARLAGDWATRLQVEERRYRETGFVRNRYAFVLGDGFGRYEDAVAVLERMDEQTPFGVHPTARSNWVGFLLALGRVEEAESLAVGLEGTAREVPFMARIELRKGDWAEAERLAMEVVRNRAMSLRWRSDALWNIASSRAAQGRIREAVTALHEMIEVNQGSGAQRDHLRAQENLLILTKAAGLDPAAWQLDGLHADTSEWARALAGLWAGESGDTALALSYCDALPTLRLGEFDTPRAHDALVAALHARVSWLGGDRDEAVRMLAAVTGERTPRAEGHAQLPNWIAAEMAEDLGQLDSAARLFGGIAAGYGFSDYDVNGFGLTYSFAHRKTALLYGQLGQSKAALEHWRAFLDAFTDPDPEYEWMVEEARTALARLEGNEQRQ